MQRTATFFSIFLLFSFCILSPALDHDPLIYKPARDIASMLVDAQKNWRLAHPEET